MTRSDIVTMFRAENPEVTERVALDTVLDAWLLIGDKDVCARTRCIVDQDGTTIPTSANAQSFDLLQYIPKFYDIDEFQGGGVLYNNKRLTKKTIAQLDAESSTWRDRTAGTPKAYYRRGKNLWLDRKIDSATDDIKVYAVLISDDFNNDNIEPYNSLSYLEPYHYALVLYLKMRAKAKVGKRQDVVDALAEYSDYCKWMKSEIGGGKFGEIYYRPVK